MHCVEMELGTSCIEHFFLISTDLCDNFQMLTLSGITGPWSWSRFWTHNFSNFKFFFFHLWCFIKDIANAIWMVHILPYSPPRWRWSSHNTCLGLCHRSPPTEKWLKSSTWRSECSHVDDQNSCRKNDQESC